MAFQERVDGGLRPSLILASASPRRAALLAERGVPFEVVVSSADESLPGPMIPSAAATFLAQLKAETVARTLKALPQDREFQVDGLGPGRWVLGADTVVALGNDDSAVLLGKPADEVEATAMLCSLSRTRHRVITGICAIDLAEGRSVTDFECTFVQMRAISPEEVRAYVASGEWRDKAGGYAIQETADAFVEKLEGGGFDNVVGLPVERSLALLGQLGWKLAPSG